MPNVKLSSGNGNGNGNRTTTGGTRLSASSGSGVSGSSPKASSGSKVASSSKAGAHVTHAARNGVHVLRYFGRVNYMSAPAIQRFLDELIEQNEITGLIFDLTGADALDSTNLGLLARVNERLSNARAESMIVCRNRDINDVLFSMGFDQSFDIVTESQSPPAEPSAHDIQTPPPSQAELHSTMLDAHRALVRLSDAGRVQFQDVVACLESDRPSH